MGEHKNDMLGYTCACGKFHQAGSWAAAHWDETLVHTCDPEDYGCGRENTIRRGRVLVAGKLPRKPRKAKKSVACADPNCGSVDGTAKGCWLCSR